MKKITKKLMREAYENLLSSEELKNNPELSHKASFHAQQTAEKSFKAILFEKEERVPKTHNIIFLGGQIKKYVNIHMDRQVIEQLNELYTPTGYPNDFSFLPDGKPPIELSVRFSKCARSIYEQTLTYIDGNTTRKE